FVDAERGPGEGQVEGPAVVAGRPRGGRAEGGEEVVGPRVEAVHGQVGRDAVRDLEPGAVLVGLVGQQVDEPGSHHEALGVDDLGALQPVVADRGDRAAVDADV